MEYVHRIAKGEGNCFLPSQSRTFAFNEHSYILHAFPEENGSSVVNVEGYLWKYLLWTNGSSSPTLGRRRTKQHGGTRPSPRIMLGLKAPSSICMRLSLWYQVAFWSSTGENTRVSCPTLHPFTEPSAQREWDEPSYVHGASLHAISPIQTGLYRIFLNVLQSLPSKTSQSHRRN